jgi:hypothetical protein
LGARFDRVIAVYQNAVLALRARAAWAHDWVSDPSLTPLFQALPGASFVVNGATLPQNSALASAGGGLRLANGGSRCSRSSMASSPRTRRLMVGQERSGTGGKGDSRRRLFANAAIAASPVSA